MRPDESSLSHLQSPVPNELMALVENELQHESGERLIWADQPLPGPLAKQTLPIFLFAIPWTAFAVFWVAAATYGTSKGNAGPFRLFPLFGLPFVAVGLGMLSSPYWAFRNARRSAYALTNRRAILFKAGWNGAMTIRSFGPERLTDLRREQRPDGTGSLIFAEEISSVGKGRTATTPVGFVGVRDVRAVEELVRQMVERR